MNRIKFATEVLTDHVINKGQQQCRYKVVQWNNRGTFDILNDISDHMTLVKLIDTAINVNHAVSIIGCWIYDSNHKRALPLIK